MYDTKHNENFTIMAPCYLLLLAFSPPNMSKPFPAFTVQNISAVLSRKIVLSVYVMCSREF